MKFNLISSLMPQVGIDLGTSRIRLWSSVSDTIVDEATCLAVDQKTQKVLAVGDEAAAMEGRVSAHITVFRPLRRGEITDGKLLQALLRVLLQRVVTSATLFRPVIMVSVPESLSKAKREVTSELLYEIGAQEVYTISQPLASAIGSGVPIADASGSFVIQLGAGIVEASIISLGSVVVNKASYEAGETLDERLAEHLVKTLELKVSRGTVGRIKQHLATLVPDKAAQLFVTGQDVVQGSPKEMTVSSQVITPVLEKILVNYQRLVQKVLLRVPPELTVDVIDKGLLLAGGVAQLEGLDQRLVKEIGVPVSVVDDPTHTVIKGIMTALEHLDEFKDSLGYLQTR